MSDTPVTDLSFEAAMAELEEVVRKIDSGEAPLEESIALYDRGEALRRHCQSKLAAAEEKIAKITAGPDGQAAALDPVDPD
ncbi:exodeoxyribonuclease VII small subunit [Halovulum sp. GXIMD14793]